MTFAERVRCCAMIAFCWLVARVCAALLVVMPVLFLVVIPVCLRECTHPDGWTLPKAPGEGEREP